MEFKTWLERIEVPPHMPHLFWKDAYKEAKELEEKFITFDEIKRLEKELEEESGFDMRLSWYMPNISDILSSRTSGYSYMKRFTTALDDFKSYYEISKGRLTDDSLWGAHGAKERTDILTSNRWNVLPYMREYSNYFLKRKDRPNYSSIENSWEELDEKTKSNILKLKNVYTAIFKYFKLLKKISQAVKSDIKYVKHKVKSYFAQTDDRAIIPETRDMEILYHATPFVKEIIRDGFKTKEELGNREALGGDTSGGISFTADLNIAREIVKCFKEVILIAQGKIKVGDIVKMAKKDGINIQTNRLMKDYVLTAKQRQGFSNSSRKLSQTTGIPMLDKAELNTPKTVFDLYKRYLASSQKRYDPIFFGASINSFEHLDTNNVGVISAQVDMKKVIHYLPSMEEYRFPKEAIIKVVTGKR